MSCCDVLPLALRIDPGESRDEGTIVEDLLRTQRSVLFAGTEEQFLSEVLVPERIEAALRMQQKNCRKLMKDFVIWNTATFVFSMCNVSSSIIRMDRAARKTWRIYSLV